MRHGEDLLVRALVVGHHQNADGTGAHDRARHQWTIADNHHVDRVAVEAECVRHEAVITGIAHLGVEIAVHEHRAGILVDLVFDRVAAERDLDEHIDVVWRIVAGFDFGKVHKTARIWLEG